MGKFLKWVDDNFFAIIIVSCFIVAVGMPIVAYLNDGKNKEINDLKAQLANAQVKPTIQRDTIRDSVPVATSTVLNIDSRTYKREIADKQLLKDLQLRLGQIEAQQRVGTRTADTIQLKPPNAFGRYDYKDQWAEFHLSIPDSLMTYSIRDSITTLIYREYKHKFLWWKWGTKGYKVKVINFNPHSTVLYNQYVRME